MDIEPRLSHRFAVYINNYLLDVGVKPEAIFNSCDIHYPLIESQSTGIPLHNIADLLEKSARHCNDPFLGFHIAQRFHYESAGITILTMLAASNVEEGIKTLSHYDQYIDQAIVTSLDIGSQCSVFSFSFVNPRNVVTHQLTEFLLILFVGMLNKGTRLNMPVQEVNFCHSSKNIATPLQEFLNAPIQYNQTENKVIFANSFLKESFYTSNETLFEILTSYLKDYFEAFDKESQLVSTVYREIIRQTSTSTPNIGQVASSIGMSERTLRRHLSNEGISFQEAKNIARRKWARYYLAKSSMSLTEIAFELGFSELSAFSRAFRHWVGETPQAYRNRLKKL